MVEFGQLINELTIEERNSFITYLKNKNKRGDTKNIDLFQYYCLGKTDFECSTNLYGVPNSTSFYALKNRLFDRLIPFLSKSKQGNSIKEEKELLDYWKVSKWSFEKGLIKTGNDILQKAKKRAIGLQNFTVLNEVLKTQIEYSFHKSVEIQKNIFQEYEKNRIRLETEERLQMTYANLREIVRESGLNFSKEKNFEAFLTSIFKKFGASVEEISTYRSLYFLLQIVNVTAEMSSSYQEIESYFEKSYKKIQMTQVSKENRFYHLSILLTLSNIFFRRREFEKRGV